jgi:hypothetical protein
MNDPAHQEWHRLFSAALNGGMSAAEKQELAALLKASAEARQLWFLYHDNECGLAELKQPAASRATGHGRPTAVIAEPQRATPRWYSWRPLTAAAAGLAIGLFSASMVFAYGMPKAVHRALALANAGFEERVAPLPDGIPVRYGVWSGDFAELTGEQQGIVPREGKQMFRFLRSDSKQVSGGPPFNGNIYQLIDARIWHEEIRSGTAVVDWSAWFNCVREDPKAPSKYEASVWAFAGDPSFVRKNWEEKLHQELAYSSWRIVADADPQSWQRIAGSIIVPPDTDFLVIELKVLPEKPAPVNGAATFAGHYVDDVRLILRTHARQQAAQLKHTRQ